MNTAYRKSPNFVFRSVAGETILVPLRAQTADLRSIYVFNETAAQVWQSLDGKRSPGDIARQITEDYEVEPSRAAKDLRTFLVQLESLGAVEEVSL